MAPSLKKALKAFIDEIPAAKLENFPGSAGTLYKDDNFRLDLQGVSVLLVGAYLGYSRTIIFRTDYADRIQPANPGEQGRTKYISPKGRASIRGCRSQEVR